MKKLISAALIFSVTMLVGGCAFNTSVGPKQVSGALTLPSKESMTIPAPSFNPNEGLSKQAAGGTKVAVTLAYWGVSYWTGVVALALVPPVLLFELCHTYGNPEPLADNSGWVWTVSCDSLGLSAKLTGKVENDSARWSMSVTGGALKDFVWFEGASTITGNSGYWTFYDTAKVNGGYTPAYEFSYSISGKNMGTVKAEVVRESDPEFGNFLEWTSQGDLKTVTGYNALKEATGQSETAIVHWNEITGAGSVENPATGAKACWDTKANGFFDIPCN